MRNQKSLLVAQLDQKLSKFKDAEMVIVPEKGWVNAIRTVINMTREQLASKLHLTKGAIQKMEEREASGQITLHKLKAIGNALEMQFVYGFVPKDESIENLIHKKAEKLARKIVLRTHQTMKLENQGIDEAKIEASIQELAHEIKHEMRKSLWD
jgi:predicted DNA-binding mobile mystery protein A